MPTRSEGACGQEFACYRTGTSGEARSKVQCLSVDIRVGCAGGENVIAWHSQLVRRHCLFGVSQSP